MIRKWKAYPLYLTMQGALALSTGIIFTASSICQVTVAGLTPLQLVLVGTKLELSVFIFEIPTGVVDDVYSRRLSIIIGMFLIGLGFLVEGTFPIFWTILLAQVLWGLGYTFTSGATEAWITDEIGEAAAGRAFLHGNQVDQVASLAGMEHMLAPWESLNPLLALDQPPDWKADADLSGAEPASDVDIVALNTEELVAAWQGANNGYIYTARWNTPSGWHGVQNLGTESSSGDPAILSRGPVALCRLCEIRRYDQCG